jgi:hypothetical protein
MADDSKANGLAHGPLVLGEIKVPPGQGLARPIARSQPIALSQRNGSCSTPQVAYQALSPASSFFVLWLGDRIKRHTSSLAWTAAIAGKQANV